MTTEDKGKTPEQEARERMRMDMERSLSEYREELEVDNGLVLDEDMENAYRDGFMHSATQQSATIARQNIELEALRIKANTAEKWKGIAAAQEGDGRTVAQIEAPLRETIARLEEEKAGFINLVAHQLRELAAAQADNVRLREVLDTARNGLIWYSENSDDADDSDTEMLCEIDAALALTPNQDVLDEYVREQMGMRWQPIETAPNASGMSGAIAGTQTMTPNEEKEVLKLAKKCGADTVDYADLVSLGKGSIVFATHELLAFVSALREKNAELQRQLDELAKQEPIYFDCKCPPEMNDILNYDEKYILVTPDDTAQLAELRESWYSIFPLYRHPANLPALIEQARQEERDACATMCEELAEKWQNENTVLDDVAGAELCADVIRARKP